MRRALRLRPQLPLPRNRQANKRISLFSFAEYPVACYGDEGEENPP